MGWSPISKAGKPSGLKLTLQAACRGIFQKQKPNHTMDLLNTLQRFPTISEISHYTTPSTKSKLDRALCHLAPSYFPTSPFPSPPRYTVHIKSYFFQFGKCAKLFAQGGP